MPKRRPPHLQRETSYRGKPVWYVRLERRGPRTRLRAEYDTPEFWEEYKAALAGSKPSKKATAGTLAWLIERYRETAGWLSFSPATRYKRENIFRQVIESAGQQPFDRITEAHIAAGRDNRGKTPFQARHFIDAMRGLFAWAKEVGFVKVDPAANVKYPKLKEGEGFPVWTDVDVAAYEKRWPVGTKERSWFEVLSHTGLRRGDAVRLGRQHLRDGEAAITTEKSGHKVEVIIPLFLFPAFFETLRASPTGNLPFKRPWEGRLQWVKENRSLIEATADDPKGTQSKWQDFDAPFCFVAACRELVAAWNDPNIVSCLPVFFDGSANAYQHLGTLVRDRDTAEKVNLVGNKRSDLYTRVANALSVILEDATGEHADSWRKKYAALNPRCASGQ